MRPKKRNRQSVGGAGGFKKANPVHQDKAVAHDILPSVTGVNAPAGAERILLDRFGHRHTVRVLKDWPDAVKQAMGLRFVDAAELANAGGGHARLR